MARSVERRAKRQAGTILLASGSEVSLIVAAAERRAAARHRRALRLDAELEVVRGLATAERDAVLPPAVDARLAVELGVPQGWGRYIGARGDMLGVERFGASAPGRRIAARIRFTVDNVCARAKALLAG